MAQANNPSPPADQFAPFVPSEQESWDLRRVNHVQRRLGFGPTYDRMQKMLKQTPAEAIDSMLNFDASVDPFAGVLEQMEGLFTIRSSEDAARWWIHRMIYTPNPTQEK